MASPTSSELSPAKLATAPEAGPGQPRRRRRRRREWFGLVALLPLVAFLVVFAIYPLSDVVRMALSNTRIANGQFVEQFNGLTNLSSFAHDGTAHYSLLITLLFIGVTVPVTVVLGTFLAIVVDRATRASGLVSSLVLWPALIAPVVVSVIWFLILSPTVGILNRALTSAGLPTQSWLGTDNGAIGSIIVVDVWHWTPLVFILIYSALKTLNTELIEAARIDGVSEYQLYAHVVLPLLKPAIIAAAGIRLTMGAKAFDEMYLLTQGGPGHATTLVSLYIRDVFFDQLKLGYGSAISLIVIIAIVAAVLLIFVGRFAMRLGWGRS